MAEAKIEELNKEEVKPEESKEACAAESSDGYTLEFRSVDNDAKRITKNEAGKCIWKEVSPLAGKTFVIKPYQRGYRWGTENVRKLLDDIWKYSKPVRGDLLNNIEAPELINQEAEGEDPNDFDFYCLQTLTVKKENEERYELIDGQQRLTTLWLIYYMLILFTCGTDEIPCPPYGIVYERNEAKDSETIKKITQVLVDKIPDKIGIVSARNKNKPSGWYDEYKDAIRTRLDPIKDDTKKGTGGALSIDLVYIENAMYTIVDFIRDAYMVNPRNVEKMFRVIQRNLFFIWYEVNTDDPYTTFTNINSNQIHLTDAELIKSLVLRKDETTSGGDKKTPTDYAKIWEEIEQGLSKDELWAYISNDQTKATRIDLLLTLYASTSENGYDGTGSLFDWYEKHKQAKEEDKKDFAKSVMDNENGLPSIYYRILEWYDNVDIFHLIGLLTKFRELGLFDKKGQKMTQEQLINNIFKTYNDCSGQEDFVNKLKGMVNNCLVNNAKVSLEEVSVEEKKKEESPEEDKASEDGKKCPLCGQDLEEDSEENEEESPKANVDESTDEKSTETAKKWCVSDNVSYEVDKKAVEAVLWTLNVWETMEASENNVGKDEKRRRTPIVNSRFPFSKISEKTKWQIEHIFPQNPKDIPNARDVFEDVDKAEKEYKTLCKKLGIKDIDRIQNLAMLKQDVNTAISNGTLEEKRKKLVEKIGKGSFVPCATVNAFLLYYSYSQGKSPKAVDYQYWTKLDAECYEARIVDCLKSFGIKGGGVDDEHC